MGLTSFIGTNIAVFLKNKGYCVHGIISNQNKNNIKKKRLNFLKKNGIKIFRKNLLQKKSFINLKKYHIIINSIGWTNNYNNNNYDFGSIKKRYEKFFKNLIYYVRLNPPDLFIEIGSSLEYGRSLKKINESSKSFPSTNYGILKLKNTNLLKKISKKFKFTVIILRVFSIYGYLDRRDKLIEFIKYKNKITINHPKLKQDFISINYFNKIVLKILKKKKFKSFDIYNCSSGIGLTPIQIINLLPNTEFKKKKITFNKIKESSSNKTQKLLIGSNRKLINSLKVSKPNTVNEIKKYLLL